MQTEAQRCRQSPHSYRRPVMEAGTNTDLLISKPNALTTKLSYLHCLNLSQSRKSKLLEKGTRETREENRRFTRSISGPPGSKHCLHWSPIIALQWIWNNGMKFSAQNTQPSEKFKQGWHRPPLKARKSPILLNAFYTWAWNAQELIHTLPFPRGSHLAQITSVKYNHKHSR